MGEQSQVRHRLSLLRIKVFFSQNIVELDVDNISDRINCGPQSYMFFLISINIIWRSHINYFNFILDLDPQHKDSVTAAILIIVFWGRHVLGDFDLVQLDHKRSKLGVVGEVVMKKIIHMFVSINGLISRWDILNIFPPSWVEHRVWSSFVLNAQIYLSVDFGPLFAVIGGHKGDWHHAER